jgi:hypothetical protein
MSLTVDEATARQFSRSCHLQAVWERNVIPSALIAAALIFILGVIGAIRHDSRLGFVALILLIALAIATTVGGLILTLLRSRHHPRLKGRGTVLIRDVDRETAQAWVNLNSPEVICIVG